MTDLHDPPSSNERDELATRVRAAADAGRMSGADRDIRLANVRSAQSRAELDLMRRDLDQLDATVVATGPAKPYSTFDAADPRSDDRPIVATNRAPLGAFVGIAVVAVVVGVAVAVAALLIHRSSHSSATPALPPAQTSSADPAGTETGQADPGGVVKDQYSLSATGIRSFLATYQKKFGTARVVDLVMYPAYAVVDVPVAGGRGRQQGWLYRGEAGWTRFGTVRAVFPGASTVDTRQLDVARLVRNLDRAKTTLKVEQPTKSYVVVRFIPGSDAVPSVDIYVANTFNESGYLATRLDGTVERAYPFGE